MAEASFTYPVFLEVPSDPSLMSAVRAVTEKISLAAGLGSEETEKLVLAVDEACTNVIRHAYGNRRDGRIAITFTPGAGRLEIAIRDFGTGGDPATFHGRDFAELRPGGLGMHFIQSTVDQMEYDRPAGGGTVLKMVKFISGQETA
ncbi:MAG: ATP-binding protein [Syntrophobacteraceae bacterium]